ncbi:UDP-N-acetylglucosamine diphosphorylase 1 [Vitis vinifera]|uniref:UDP-N-acetylglucosamine diphosphorylase n=1 Tax=Vitis vinifera TaxID=29760 RepID=A0A438J1E3_VITVI|nr:UDP-N-acetylglucosamine diphosphorylase 1 [Vitis vinifera]
MGTWFSLESGSVSFSDLVVHYYTAEFLAQIVSYGTRLGSSDPKGCFNIGLPSGKSLFQLQAERILCVQRLAAQSTNEGSGGFVPIHWYIMTSPFTDDVTRKFFESHKYFGLEADQVRCFNTLIFVIIITFFQQGTIPCISKDGRFIMETPYKVVFLLVFSPIIYRCGSSLGLRVAVLLPNKKVKDVLRKICASQVAKAPDGNGGVYSALKSSRLLEDMATRGVKYLDCYGVDNALVRVADPTFLGYFIDKGVASAAKVVRKVLSKAGSLLGRPCEERF